MSKFPLRYERNKILTPKEQEQLSEKRAAVIGCGGLGGYIIEMLGRMGVGHIVVCDGDVFAESNLNRQLLCGESDLGKFKAKAAADRLAAVNSEVQVTAVCDYFDEKNAAEIIAGCDVVLDGLDNPKTKVFLEETCRKLEIPLIHGAISGWSGQVTAVLPGDDTLDRLYEDGGESHILADQGNPAFTPALVAAVQVSEAVKVLTGKGELLRKRVLFMDLLYGDVEIVEI